MNFELFIKCLKSSFSLQNIIYDNSGLLSVVLSFDLINSFYNKVEMMSIPIFKITFDLDAPAVYLKSLMPLLDCKVTDAKRTTGRDKLCKIFLSTSGCKPYYNLSEIFYHLNY